MVLLKSSRYHLLSSANGMEAALIMGTGLVELGATD
jgi:hypothetical protein